MALDRKPKGGAEFTKVQSSAVQQLLQQRQSQTLVGTSRQRKAELAQDNPAEGAEQSGFSIKGDSEDHH